MSSEGTPLPGFRKLFFLAGSFFGICAIWTVVDLLYPNEQFAKLNPPGSESHTFLVVIVPVCAVFSVANFWFWRQLRQQKFTPRNWVIGLLLLLPSIFCLFGILFILRWCSDSYQDLFVPARRADGVHHVEATSDELSVPWAPPWDLAADDSGVAARELRRECCRRHVLHKVPVALVAHRCDCDDVLFRLLDGSGRYAAVHLTFAVENDPRPDTEMYSSLSHFITERLQADIADYNA